MEIKNITIAEYVTTNERELYDYLINYITDSKDIFKIGDFTQLQFGTIKEIQYKYSKGISIKDILDFICDVTKKDLKEIGKLKILDFIKVNNYIRKQIEFINSIEENSLVSAIEPDEEQADIDRFNKFGYQMQIRSLAANDITKEAAIKAMKYEECFVELVIRKTEHDYSKDLNRIRTRPHGKV